MTHDQRIHAVVCKMGELQSKFICATHNLDLDEIKEQEIMDKLIHFGHDEYQVIDPCLDTGTTLVRVDPLVMYGEAYTSSAFYTLAANALKIASNLTDSEIAHDIIKKHLQTAFANEKQLLDIIQTL